MSCKGMHWKRPDITGANNPAKRPEIGRKISEKLKGRKAEWNKKCKGQKRPNTSKALILAYKEGRAKPRKFRNGGFRPDLNAYFRSNWEANMARIWNYEKKIWRYEPEVFFLNVNGKDCTYRPDFFLPKERKWYEVKGYWFNDFEKQKFLEFKRTHKVTLIDESCYKYLLFKYKKKVKNLEVSKGHDY